MSIIISTGNIKQDYSIVDIIFAMDSHKQGFITSADPNIAFAGLKNQLKEKCKALHGDAVINCQFEYRVALDKGVMSSKQVMEIFAYGTVISFI